MTQTTRFGRRLALPSTAELKHELRLMAAANDLRQIMNARHEGQGSSEEQAGALAGDLARTHGLSVDRAQMLVDRFELAQ